MKKFKVGDIVMANSRSSIVYRKTNLDRKWVGYISDVYKDGTFKAKTISSDSVHDKGTSYDDLEPQNFDLVKESKKGKVLVSNQATILFDEDGRKYVSKCSNEEFDLEKGIMMCLCKKHGYTYEDIRKFIKNTECKDVKEVKCEAVVGEYTKIVSPFMTRGHYKMGDILKVKESLNGKVFCEGVPIILVSSEYVVLKGYKPE